MSSSARNLDRAEYLASVRRWRCVPLQDVCEERTGIRNPDATPDAVFHYIDISAVDNRTKRIVAPKKLLGYQAPSRARQVVRAGDVVVSTTRPNLNAVALVPPDLDNQICSTGFCVLRPKSDLDSGFLFAFVQSSRFVDALSGLVKGALYPAVTDSQVRAQTIPLPPLAEQKLIVVKLNEQMAAVERARAATEAQLAAVRILPEQKLRLAFKDGVNRWPKRPLGEMCDLRPAKSVSSDGDVAVHTITTACLRETGFNPLGVKEARMWQSDAALSKVEIGEVLVARSNTPELVGRAAVYKGAPGGVVASDLTIRIWSRSAISSDFLAAYLSFLFVSGYWKERAGGASGSMKKITRSQLLAEQIPCPPSSVQNKLVTEIGSFMKNASEAARRLQEQLQGVQQLPNSLLSAALGRGVDE